MKLAGSFLAIVLAGSVYAQKPPSLEGTWVPHPSTVRENIAIKDIVIHILPKGKFRFKGPIKSGEGTYKILGHDLIFQPDTIKGKRLPTEKRLMTSKGKISPDSTSLWIEGGRYVAGKHALERFVRKKG